MANVTVTFTITEFCLHTGISEEELNEIVGLGVVEPREIQETTWVFDDHAAIVVQRAVRLRHELALDWPGIAVALTLMDDIAHLKQENRLLRQRLSRFVAHPGCVFAGCDDASGNCPIMPDATLNASFQAHKRRYLFWWSLSTNTSNNWLSAA